MYIYIVKKHSKKRKFVVWRIHKMKKRNKENLFFVFYKKLVSYRKRVSVFEREGEYRPEREQCSWWSERKDCTFFKAIHLIAPCSFHFFDLCTQKVFWLVCESMKEPKRSTGNTCVFTLLSILFYIYKGEWNVVLRIKEMFLISKKCIKE